MGFTTLEKQICTLLGLMVLFPAFCTSRFTGSRATYYGSPQSHHGTPTGACGFGAYGRTVNDGLVTGVTRLYTNGSGCGACYQVKCKDNRLCKNDGVNVVVTDYAEGDRADFILIRRAYEELAKPNAAKELFAYGVVEIEYERISCHYSGHHIMYKVHEHSRYPHYLSLTIMYVAGQNDVTAVEIWQENNKEWRPMHRAYGAVWDMENPPRSSVTLRFQATSNLGHTFWVQSNNVIPKYWKAGASYNSNVQLH